MTSVSGEYEDGTEDWLLDDVWRLCQNLVEENQDEWNFVLDFAKRQKGIKKSKKFLEAVEKLVQDDNYYDPEMTMEALFEIVKIEDEDGNKKKSTRSAPAKKKHHAVEEELPECKVDHTKQKPATFDRFDEKHYFKEGQKYHGCSCLFCGICFVAGKVAKGATDQVQVGDNNPVYVCGESKRDKCRCTRMVCIKCWCKDDKDWSKAA